MIGTDGSGLSDNANFPSVIAGNFINMNKILW